MKIISILFIVLALTVASCCLVRVHLVRDSEDTLDAHSDAESSQQQGQSQGQK